MADFLKDTLGISERVFYGNALADWVVAGLVALALQNVLGDLFASLSITLDKPFVVGDLLTIDTFTGAVERIVREQSNARFERCHLKILADFALQFELSYFVQQPKINSLLDLQQAVNFRIIDELRRLGVEFAYPTQRVLIAN
jgi:small-conductance mechanosensitive channel